MHEVSSFKGQSSPALFRTSLGDGDIDQPMLTALMARWFRRYEAAEPAWEDVALMRSLNMAYQASLPASHVGPGFETNAPSNRIAHNQARSRTSAIPNLGRLMNSSTARIVSCHAATASSRRYCARTENTPWPCAANWLSIRALASSPDIVRMTLKLSPWASQPFLSGERLVLLTPISISAHIGSDRTELGAQWNRPSRRRRQRKSSLSGTRGYAHT